jgi:hypothetical protein
MDKDSAGLFPEVAVFEVIVDEDVTGVHVVALVAGLAGDDGGSGEMMGGPGVLLGLGPMAFGASGENDWVEVTDGVEELLGIGDELEVAEEAWMGAEAGPEFLLSDDFLGFAGRHAEDSCGFGVKVGEDAVAVEEKLGHTRAPWVRKNV